MAGTPNLVLPYLAANQALKHFTVNEALRRLDALMQITVQSASLNTPPGSLTDGQRWIVGAAPTGVWLGHAGQIAAWQDGAWAFYAPLDGWTAIDISTDTLLLYNAGTGIWVSLITGVFSDAAFTLQDDIDPSKQARFQIAGFTAGATRVFTLPDATTSLAGLAAAQTFSAKQTLSNANNDLGTSTGHRHHEPCHRCHVEQQHQDREHRNGRGFGLNDQRGHRIGGGRGFGWPDHQRPERDFCLDGFGNRHGGGECLCPLPRSWRLRGRRNKPAVDQRPGQPLQPRRRWAPSEGQQGRCHRYRLLPVPDRIFRPGGVWPYRIR